MKDPALIDVLLGVYLLVFGMAKAVIGCLALTSLPARESMAKNSVLRLFVETDTTTAGKFAEVVLVLFGLYSLAHGAALLGLASQRVTAFFEHPHMYTLIYGGFAALLLGFYSLVLFTDVGIEKDPSGTGHYWLAWASGLTFLLVPLTYALWQALSQSPIPAAHVTAFLLAALVVSSLLYIGVRRAFQNRSRGSTFTDELITLATIPLSAM